MRARRFVEGALARAGVRIDGPEPWDLEVRDDRLYARLLRDGSLGLGEAYMDGWWDSERIDETLYRILTARVSPGLWWRARAAVALAFLHAFNWQGPRRARRAIAAHYDLGNEFFEDMLGRTMTYSCAYWREARGLDEAQDDKHELICRKLGLSAGDRILDVGCGWGGFARYAADNHCCKVVGITVSREQAEYARRFCSQRDVVILELDYRSPEIMCLGPFDHVVSVGMFEHVGVRNYRTFMQRMSQLLAEDGLFLLQTVGRHRSQSAERWVTRYIFPDGMLPSACEILRASERWFVLEDWHNFRADYDHTLRAWEANFADLVRAQPGRFDERFCRMWRYYLLAFAASFRDGTRSQLWQVIFSKHGVEGGYGAVR